MGTNEESTSPSRSEMSTSGDQQDCMHADIGRSNPTINPALHLKSDLMSDLRQLDDGRRLCV